MFQHNRRSSNGTSIPTWLTLSKTALVKCHVRQSKHDPLVDEVEVLEVNPCYTKVKYPSDREDNVSLKHVAPCSNNSDRIVTDHSPSKNLNMNSADSSVIPVRTSLDISNIHSAETVDLSNNMEHCLDGTTVNDAHLFSSNDDDEEFLGFR